MRSSIMHMNQVYAPHRSRKRSQVQWPDVKLLYFGGKQQKRSGRRKQTHFVPGGSQSSHQMKRLPLPAVHCLSGVDVENEQCYLLGLIFLALAYFRKL